MKTSILGLVVILATLSFAAIAERSIYLVRHAEKQADGTRNPSLTKLGQQRAANIAEQLKNKNINAIYSTDYLRTQQTAAPLSKLLNLEIKSYDPRKLQEFAEEIKTTNGNLLIVGHSNTTPALAFYLGGDAYGDIDESEYDRLYQLNFTNENVSSELLRSKPIKKFAPAQPVAINPALFRKGQHTYQMSFNNKVVGTAVHQFESDNQLIKLKEKTVIKDFGIDADIAISVNKHNLSPAYMKLTGSMGEPVDIHLNWNKANVSGHSLQARAPYKAQGKLKVDRKLSRNTVERSSVLMLAHLFELKKEKTNTFEWYNAYDDATKMIEASYLGDETITVPAGTFETRKIQFLGGAPSQIYYISKEKHPKVIKIEIIAMPWLYELIKVE